MTAHASTFTTGDGYRIAYRLDGPEDRPVLVLSNSIGTTMHMWDGEIAALAESHRVLRYDTRGHGGSDAPPGAYSFDRMGRDVIELMDALKIERAHFLGLSFGGFIGQWMAVHAPERIDRLVLANTSSYLGPSPPWDERINSVLGAKDMSDTAATFLKNWFPPDMLERDDAIVAPFRATLLAMSPQGLAGSFAAVRDGDMRRTITLITAPTLVIVGERDQVTLPSHGERIAASIRGAKLVSLLAVHMSNVECRPAFLEAVLTFLAARSG
ncbi:MAG: alpha/beta fold hydrolase [Polyangiaceae bacterium]|nr:alpha/beta fold hydrolase [Polyangiaceae bacterium]